jgi:hypothetical protein
VTNHNIHWPFSRLPRKDPIHYQEPKTNHNNYRNPIGHNEKEPNPSGNLTPMSNHNLSLPNIHLWNKGKNFDPHPETIRNRNWDYQPIDHKDLADHKKPEN